MSEILQIDECKKLHPDQWVKIYGVASKRYDYIITCQVYQLEVVLGVTQSSWWDNYVLQPVDEEEQAISIKEAFEKSSQLENSLKGTENEQRGTM